MTDRGTRAGVGRHAVDLEQARYWAENLPDVIGAQIKAARLSLDVCNALATSGQSYAGYLSIVEPASDRICWALRLAMDARSGVFKGAIAGQAQEPRIEIELDGEVTSVATTVDESFLNVGDWIETFFLAAICRQKTILDAICNVPLDLLLRSSTRSPEYWHLFTEALQAFWTGDRSLYRKTHAAALATDPDDPNLSDHALYIGGPQTDLLWRLLKALPGSPDGQVGVERFNKSLAIALDYHKRFWSQKEDNRWCDPDGYLARGLLGLASIAHDSKVSVEVESDYIPRPLVEGACRRSPWTSAKSLE